MLTDLASQPAVLDDAQDICCVCYEPLVDGVNHLIEGHYVHACCKLCSRKWIEMSLAKYSLVVSCPMCTEPVPLAKIEALIGPAAVIDMCTRRDAELDQLFCRNPKCDAARVAKLSATTQQPTLKLHKRSRDFGADGVCVLSCSACTDCFCYFCRDKVTTPTTSTKMSSMVGLPTHRCRDPERLQLARFAMKMSKCARAPLAPSA